MTNAPFNDYLQRTECREFKFVSPRFWDTYVLNHFRILTRPDIRKEFCPGLVDDFGPSICVRLASRHAICLLRTRSSNLARPPRLFWGFHADFGKVPPSIISHKGLGNPGILVFHRRTASETITSHKYRGRLPYTGIDK